MGSDPQGSEPPCSAHIRSEIWDVGMEVLPLRSGSGPVKVGYGKNSDGSDLVLPSGEVRVVLEMGVMGWLVKSGHPCWKSLPMFVRHGLTWVELGIHAQARCDVLKKSTPVAGNIGLVTVGTEIRGPYPVDGVCYGINDGRMKDYLVGDKPVCAGDGDTKSWSTDGFMAILVSPIRHGELMISLGLHVPFDRIGCLGLLVWLKGFSRQYSSESGSQTM